MEAVVGLLLMLLGVSHSMETDCDGRQDGAQCYGALGGTVVIKLMDGASGTFKLYKHADTEEEILYWVDNKLISNELEKRSLFTPNDGKFKINNLNWSDVGNYTLELFNSQGHILKQRTLQLTIQAPVSSVLLVSECLSQGEMRVSCSSQGGDSPQYSWTLDGQTLTDTQLLSGNTESKNITLRQNVSGRLKCSVRNHVSEVWREEKISTCGFIHIECISNGTHVSKWVFEANNTLCIPTTTTARTEGKETSITPSTNITSSNENVTSTNTDHPWYIRHLPIMGGVLAALLILLMVGLIVVCIHKKKKSSKPEGEEDEHELTYADVKIVRKHGQQMPPRAETEVEYGQVKFSERPVVTAQPEGDDCVYTVVRKNR